ncbi:MAG: TonB-dependent receptor domain-containing protein [Candidatus Acidiferrales bacterium]
MAIARRSRKFVLADFFTERSERGVGLLSRRLRLAKLLASAAIFLLIVVSGAWAQKDTGGIAGTVKDASGGVVVGAKVTVTDVDRGEQLVLATNGVGEYVASPLKVGRYTVTVEKSGFKKAVAGPVVVQVQERPAVNLTLEVGSADEIVKVTGASPLLETETSDLGNVIDARQAVTLPLNGRNYAQLALLGAGIAPSEPGSRVEGSYGFSSNGARSLQNNFLLDGVDNNSNLGDVLTGQAYVIQPSVDAIEEFKVQTNAYSAEFGRGNGAILNAVIKSGTNSFHGDVYEFFRNDAFDARNAFDAFGRQPYHQNQFGATLGGPIIKDKTFFFIDYEGFRVIQATPQLSTVPTPAEIGGDFSSFLTNTPAPQVDVNGNVIPNSVALDCSGNPTFFGEIFNARMTQPSALNPSGFCGVPIAVNGAGVPTNIFPKGSIDPLAARLAALFPAPNVNLAGGNFLSEPKKTQGRDNGDVRIDHRFSQADSIFGRFSYENQPSFTPAPFPNELDGGAFSDGSEDDSFRSIALSETHIFSPNLVNEFRLGYNRINSHRFQLNANTNISAQLGYPGVPFGPNLGGLPQISINDGTATIGSAGFLPAIEKQNSYVLSENLTWLHGRHSWKFGTELRREQFTLLEPSAARGTVNFGSDFTDNPAATTTGGDAFATFLLGLPDGGSITNVHNVEYQHWTYAFYAQDDFRMTPRLTFNLGLRYELFATIKAANNEQGTFDFANDSILVPAGQTAQLTPFLAANIPIERTGSAGLINPDLNNFAPRIGLAYKITDKLVLRTGYGIFYGGQENGPYSNPSPGFNPPYFVTQSFNQPCFLPSANPATPADDCSIPNFNVLSQGFPANSLTDPNTPILFSINPKIRTPYTQQWHLGFQYQLPAQSVFKMSYAGSHGSDLYNFYNGNQAVVDPTFCTTAPNTPGNCPTDARRPARQCDTSVFPPNCNPVFDTSISELRSDGFSNYNSLQLSYDKSFSHGFQMEAAYTYAHALDDASSAALGSLNNGDFRDQRFPFLEYGNSDFDVRHRFVISYIYQLPFGNGKRFGGSATGWKDQLIGNWQVAGITTAQSGNWFTITDAFSSVSSTDGGGGVGFFETRPNVIGNPNGPHCLPNTLFNTGVVPGVPQPSGCAFADNTIPFTFGNAGRNIVRGPGLQNWDFSIFKTFPVHEQMHFEFRAEFFNIWNHVNPLFEPLDLISEEPTSLEFGTPQFGAAQGARDPRFIQFALKFYF